ncbi:hypothetical protein AHAS_Ahas15G0251800 [Arachis hypogaea]
MSEDHARLESNLIFKVIFSMIVSNTSVLIRVLQGDVEKSYKFKGSYKEVWMTKQKSNFSDLWRLK